jgi:hypothetical protein
MNSKEIFFDFDNFEFHQNIYIKTLKLDEFNKRTTEKKSDFWKGGPEAPTMFPILKDDNTIDKEHMYIIKYQGGIYKINLTSLEYTFIKDTMELFPYFDNKLNKYFGFNMRDGRIEASLTYGVENNKRKQIAYPINNLDKLEQFYIVKQKENSYFMKMNNDIYLYGPYYRIYIQCSIQDSNGAIVNFSRDTGIDTTLTKNTELIEYKKDAQIHIRHNKSDKIISINEKYKNTKLLDYKFYYDFRRNYMIFQEQPNEYNINTDNFDDLATCKNKVILKNVYSALHDNTINGKNTVVEGIVSRRDVNNEKTVYECTNGFTCIKQSYFEGFSMDEDFTLQHKNKIFELTDIKQPILHTPFSCFFNSDVPCNITYWNNKYFAYFRLNTKMGGRQIHYTSSEDMINWDKFRLLKIKGFDIDVDHMYHPNIFKYQNTKYVIALLKHHNTDMNRLSYDIVMSRDGINFKYISTLLSISSDNIHVLLSHDGKHTSEGDLYFLMNGLVEHNTKFKLYMFELFMEGLQSVFHEYSCHMDELFYLTTDYDATCCTKLIKVFDNKIILNYKCKEEGYIKVKLTDKYDNLIEGFNFTDFDTLNNNDYEIKELSWNNISEITYDYVKIHIHMFNSNIYSVSGEFYEHTNSFNCLLYKVNDLSRTDGYLQDKSEKYLHININDKYGMSAKDIVSDIEYNDDYTKASIYIRLINDKVERILLHDSINDIVEHRDLKFKRPICVLNYKLIDIP